MEMNLTVTCKSCEMKVPMSNTHFDRSGANLLCNECYKRLCEQERVMQTADSGRTRYACAYCGYKFSRDVDTSVDGCPFCGKVTVAIEKKGNKKIDDF